MPLPLNITSEDMFKVISKAELVGMACSVDELAVLAPVLGGCPTLRTFVVTDHQGNPIEPCFLSVINSLLVFIIMY